MGHTPDARQSRCGLLFGDVCTWLSGPASSSEPVEEDRGLEQGADPGGWAGFSALFWTGSKWDACVRRGLGRPHVTKELAAEGAVMEGRWYYSMFTLGARSSTFQHQDPFVRAGGR